MMASVGAVNAQQQVVRVGIGPNPGAFTVFDERTGAASGGATLEILEMIATDAGLALQYVPITGAGSNPFVEALSTDKIDLIVYTSQVTPARQEQYDFSDPVLSYGEALVVQKGDTTDYKSADDLKGVAVGVVAGSSYVDIATRVGADVKLYESSSPMVDVNAGTLTATIGSAPTFIYQALYGPYPNVKVVSGYTSKDVLPAAFGVKKGKTALLETINASLAKFQADGTVKTILAKYGL
jgi:polar amino acid transport system substrate-binding protein